MNLENLLDIVDGLTPFIRVKGTHNKNEDDNVYCSRTDILRGTFWGSYIPYRCMD
jgi:hypothetical protein